MNKKKKRKLKKRVYAILAIIILVIIYFIFNNQTIKTENKLANITRLYIYGNYMNLEGNIKNIDKSYQNIELVLYNGKFKTYKLKTTKEGNNINFRLSNKVNRGLLLDKLSKGKYKLFIRISNKEDEDLSYKYYKLNNKTDYKTTTYYTLSKYNKKITINSNNNYKTLMLNVENNQDKNVYDIVIDPGHGGIDVGCNNEEYTESNITMKISSQIAKKLKEKGLKVKLTRTKNSLEEDEYFQEYEPHGRALIPYEVHAKYLLSIHVNSSESSRVNGVELYTANNINYNFSTKLIKDILDTNLIEASTKDIYKIKDGIYTHNFTKEEIQENLEDYIQDGDNPYDITTNSNYLYMIRETGGIITGTYIDDRNKETVGYNPYYKSNVGVEGYLLELGYLTNSNDLTVLTENQKKYANTIANSIAEYLNNL